MSAWFVTNCQGESLKVIFTYFALSINVIVHTMEPYRMKNKVVMGGCKPKVAR